MSLSFEQLHHPIFLITDALKQYFYCLLTILVEHLEISPKIIENHAIRSTTIHHYQVYASASTKLIYLQLLVQVSLSCYNHVKISHILQIARVVSKPINFDVMIQLLQLVNAAVQSRPTFIDVLFSQEELST